VIIAVPVVRVMQMTIDEIVDMIAVGDRFMPAARAMHVSRLMAAAHMVRRAAIRIDRRDRQHMFVHMAAMHVMQMPIMKIVDMTVVLHSRMPAARAMLMGMVGVMWLFAIRHNESPLECVNQR
jgi:hypothetical protein